MNKVIYLLPSIMLLFFGAIVTLINLPWRAANIEPLPQVYLSCVTDRGERPFRSAWNTAALMSSSSAWERDGLLSSIRRSRSAGTNPHPSKTSDHHVIVHGDALQGLCLYIMNPRELPTAQLIISLCTVCVCMYMLLVCLSTVREIIRDLGRRLICVST